MRYYISFKLGFIIFIFEKICFCNRLKRDYLKRDVHSRRHRAIREKLNAKLFELLFEHSLNEIFVLATSKIIKKMYRENQNNRHLRFELKLYYLIYICYEFNQTAIKHLFPSKPILLMINFPAKFLRIIYKVVFALNYKTKQSR